MIHLVTKEGERRRLESKKVVPLDPLTKEGRKGIASRKESLSRRTSNGSRTEVERRANQVEKEVGRKSEGSRKEVEVESKSEE